MSDLLPISALQHLLYCDRQCALIHLERQWEENRFTAEGRALHERAHEGPSESRPGIRITRGLTLVSRRLSIWGQADVVEFHRDGTVTPIEYKRGKPKAHRADEVQLCAQALCLEETPGGTIREGFLFYGKTRRRTVVIFDSELRELTESLIGNLRELLNSGRTPPAVFEAKKCSACSLLEICMPRLSNRPSVKRWFREEITNLKLEI